MNSDDEIGRPETSLQCELVYVIRLLLTRGGHRMRSAAG
jgi:hypothetical protein